MPTRRSFLVGLGGLVTSAFITRAKAHVLDTGQPLLIRPKRVDQMLYLYEGFEPDGGEHPYKYRVSLGPDQEMTPAPPTWREHLTGNGHSLATQEEVERFLRQKGLHLDDLDQPLPVSSWEPYWDHYASPQARAHQLLRDLQLDCDASAHGPRLATSPSRIGVVTPAAARGGWT